MKVASVRERGTGGDSEAESVPTRGRGFEISLLDALTTLPRQSGEPPEVLLEEFVALDSKLTHSMESFHCAYPELIQISELVLQAGYLRIRESGSRLLISGQLE